MFSSANSVCVGTNHSQSFPSYCLSTRRLGIVTDTKMQSSQFRKEISSQFLLKFDHDSSQHSGTGKAFRPAPHTSKPSRSSRVVNQSIWNDFTAGNCSETILTSARKKNSGVLRIFTGSPHAMPGITVLESSGTPTKKILPSTIHEPTLCRFSASSEQVSRLIPSSL